MALALFGGTLNFHHVIPHRNGTRDVDVLLSTFSSCSQSVPIQRERVTCRELDVKTRHSAFLLPLPGPRHGEWLPANLTSNQNSALAFLLPSEKKQKAIERPSLG